MARINLVVSDDTKKKWDRFVKNSKITTLSKLIRLSVDKFIESKIIMEEREKLSNISHNIMEELSLISGYSQMLTQNLKDKLDFQDLKSLNSIYHSSQKIENIIKFIQAQKIYEQEDIDILVVDDNRDYIELVSQIIKDNNLSFKTSLSGYGVLELLKIFSPKLILLDILLPDIKGDDICLKIKQNKMLKDIPVYYITAVPETEVIQKVEATKADGYLIKGFEIEEFKDVLKKYNLINE